MKKYELVLGSSSPRRKDILQLLDIPFTIVKPDVDETLNPNLSLVDQCQYLAQKKAKRVQEMLSTNIGQNNLFILTADTLVGIDKIKLEKPKDLTDSKVMLKKLSGRTHQVVTGLCFLYRNDHAEWKEQIVASSTEVTFHPLSENFIDYYVATQEGLDKAGAYGVQGLAQAFIKSLHGTYSNVVGLPLDIVVQFIEQNIATGNTHWKNMFVSSH